MPRLHLALSVVLLAAVAAVAPPMLSACSLQTEGQRCDVANSGDADCESGLVCTSKDRLAEGLVDRCCPPSQGTGDCTPGNNGTGGSAGTGGSGGNAGSGGAAPTYTCQQSTNNATCQCPDGSTQTLLVCTSTAEATGTSGAAGTAGAAGSSSTTSFSQCPCASGTAGSGGSGGSAGSAGASGSSGSSGQAGGPAGAAGSAGASAGAGGA